eukprot:305801-Rhodomonas_salina.2
MSSLAPTHRMMISKMHKSPRRNFGRGQNPTQQRPLTSSESALLSAMPEAASALHDRLCVSYSIWAEI